MPYWSGLNVGEESFDVLFLQELLNRPETGIWNSDDEETYLEWLIQQGIDDWEVVSEFFPANWWHAFHA